MLGRKKGSVRLLGARVIRNDAEEGQRRKGGKNSKRKDKPGWKEEKNK